MPIILSHSEFTGVTTYADYNEADDSITLHHTQDCEEILRRNKSLASAGREHYAHDPDFWHVASIPVLVVHKWMVEENVDVYSEEDWPKVKALLNSNEYRYLKTAEVII